MNVTKIRILAILIAASFALFALVLLMPSLYLATENSNFEKLREKSKLDCKQMPIHCAVEANDMATLISLLNSGTDLSITDNWQRSALHWAAAHGHPDSVRVLLEAGADPNARDEHGEPILVDAARAGHFEIARMLLAAGAMVNPSKPGPQTPLHAAVSSNNFGLVELLIEKGADISAKDALGRNSLELSKERGSHLEPTSQEIVDALIEAGQ